MQGRRAWRQVSLGWVLAFVCLSGVVAGCADPTGTGSAFSVERGDTKPALLGSSAPTSPEVVAAQVVGAGAVVANATVVHLSDGDTITVKFPDGGQEKVRLIGIDTPETKRPNTPVQCFGPEATRFMTGLLPLGTAVRIERDVEERDRYGRLLGYVFRASDGLFINVAIARYGYASLLTYPPNVAHVDQFTDAVSLARDEARGLWRACPTTVGS